MHANIKLSLIFTLLFVSFPYPPYPAKAAILHVPQEFMSIQTAIDSGAQGDTVLVQPGTYMENIDFGGKNLTVGSLFFATGDTSFISQTIIDGNRKGNVVVFKNGEGAAAFLTGFTITNGLENNGGGVYCFSSSPTLKNLRIVNNSARQFGGGIICVEEADPMLYNVTISDNSANLGGGIYCWHSSPTMENVSITNNGSQSGGGIFCFSNSNPILRSSMISKNRANGNGGGICCEDSCNLKLYNLTITENSSSYGGGIGQFNRCSIQIMNSILWLNNSSQGIYLNQGSNITISYSDIEGGEDEIYNSSSTVYWEERNIEADPQFGGSGSHPYRLSAISQGIDAGNPDTTGLGLPRVDLAGNTRIYGDFVDIGAYEYQSDLTSNSPPTAAFMVSPNSGTTSTVFQFDASISYDYEDPSSILMARWDWENDGLWDTEYSIEKWEYHIYQNPGSYIAKLEVMDSGGLTVIYTMQVLVRAVESPTFFPIPGSYVSPLYVVINTIMPGAEIYYTIDGTEPTIDDSMYQDPIHIMATTVLKAIAYKSDLGWSEIATGVYYIGGNLLTVPERFPTIQAAIDSAIDGDTILVQPGTYNECIDFKGKSIVVGSLYLFSDDTSYIARTIIDGNEEGHVVKFVNGESPNTMLNGFKIVNGYAPNDGGGGIHCNGNSSPNLINIIVSNNYSKRGGGIYCDNGSNPIMTNMIIEDNIASLTGGGIYSYNSNPNLMNVSIQNNRANFGGGIICYYSELGLNNIVFKGNIASGGWGGAIYCDQSRLMLNNSTIGNNISNDGGGLYCYWSYLFLTNTILWDNVPQEIYSVDQSSSITINYSDIQGGENGVVKNGGELIWGEGNISDNPKYTGFGPHSLQLSSFSPCIDAGIPDTIDLNIPQSDLLGYQRIRGERIDMGAYEFRGKPMINSALNNEVVLRMDDNNETASVQFPATALSLQFQSGDIKGKNINVTGYGETLPGSVHSGEVFTKAIGYYSIESGEIAQLAAVLSILYADSLLNKSGFTEDSLLMAYWDKDTEMWKALRTTINEETNMATTAINHFSLWALTDKTDDLIVNVEEKERETISEEYGLSQNYPNPFNPITSIRFSLPKEERVRIAIYNILGQRVRLLANEAFAAGSHAVAWDGRDDGGHLLASGVYIYEFRAGEFVERKKMTLLR